MLLGDRSHNGLFVVTDDHLVLLILDNFQAIGLLVLLMFFRGLNDAFFIFLLVIFGDSLLLSVIYIKTTLANELDHFNYSHAAG